MSTLPHSMAPLAPTGLQTIADVAPDRATYRPGEPTRITVRINNAQAEWIRGYLTLILTHLDQIVQQTEQPVDLTPATTTAVIWDFTPPAISFRGYGVEVILTDAAGSLLARGSGALDVLEHWSQAPRYGFLADFAPAQNLAARCDSLCRYHLNVVQCYDWMWRHYRLLPPTDDFTDALGRRLSLATVRAAIAGIQARGGAALAYGAVYGAEPEFADAHPELALYDEQGQRISLANLFYIMNIAPDSPWVPLIVAEFATVVRELGFDGIHLDQYGFPHAARTATGELVDLAEHFPLLIDAARAAVVAERPTAGVIFNAVENWPITTVAPTTQDAVYIEVWPPDVTYNDLRRLIDMGKQLSSGKHVILAAYLSPFATADAATLPQAEAAALLVTATIAASGGTHLLTGERDGVLCDPYYPKYATFRPAFATQMRGYYDFLVRYEEWLIAPDVLGWEPHATEIVTLQGARLRTTAEAGSVWAITTCKPGYRVVHLINLVQQQDVAWNAFRTPVEPLHDLELRIAGMPVLHHVLVLTPDEHGGSPQRLIPTYADGQVLLHILCLRVWTMIVCVFHGDAAVTLSQCMIDL